MNFTLKDIPGAVVEKNEPNPKYYRGGNTGAPYLRSLHFWQGFRSAAIEQSSVRLRFNREKLAKLARGYNGNNRKGSYEIADAIIAAAKYIIEVDKGGL